MQAIDHHAIKELGIPGILLMENAGRSIVELMKKTIPELNEKKVLVVAGKGNNGGDGFVIARHLHNIGVSVSVWLIGKRSQLKGDAKTNSIIAFNQKIPIFEINEKNFNSKNHSLSHSNVVVDAIFGTGLTKRVSGFYEKIIKKINSSKKFVVSVDIPSGIDSDSGELIGPCIKSNLTAALAFPKRSHLLYPAAEQMGKIEILDISIPQNIEISNFKSVNLIESSDIKPLFPSRAPNTHKGSYGHVLVVGGSRGKGGAAGMTGLAALRIGAGLVTLAIPESCYSSLEFNPLETMSISLPETKSGSISLKAMDILLKEIQNKEALAIGPGLSTHEEVIKCIDTFLPQVPCPIILDADGLNSLAKIPKLLERINVPTILTPHLREFSRIVGKPLKNIIKNRFNEATEFAQHNGVIIILKGANSIVALPNGELLINPTGNPGLAKAGSGDILTGMIAGLTAQKFSPKDASMAGVYLHGLAGDFYKQNFNENTLIASDLLQFLPKVINSLNA